MLILDTLADIKRIICNILILARAPITSEKIWPSQHLRNGKLNLKVLSRLLNDPILDTEMGYRLPHRRCSLGTIQGARRSVRMAIYSCFHCNADWITFSPKYFPCHGKCTKSTSHFKLYNFQYWLHLKQQNKYTLSDTQLNSSISFYHLFKEKSLQGFQFSVRTRTETSFG